MTKTPYGDALRQTRSLFESGTSVGLTDRELLERFERCEGEVAETAFAVIVGRHGPLVLRTCRAVLGDEHEALDAFQATFLILVRKGGSVRVDESLSPWLFGVARRVALCARAASVRRWRHEREAASRSEISMTVPDPDDLAAVLLEEMDRLPERFRSAVVTCDLEGLTQEQAAARLGWPLGTVRSRLSRGRERLKGRLTRRGLAPSLTPFVLPPLSEATIKTTVQPIISKHVPLTIRLLAQAGLHAMQIIRWKKLAALCVVLGLAATGAGLIARYSVGQSPKPALAEVKASSKNDQPFILRSDNAIVQGSVDGQKFWGYSPTTRTWRTYKTPDGVTAYLHGVVQGAVVTPLSLFGAEINEVVVFYAKTGEWVRQPLKSPAKQQCYHYPAGENFAIYRLGQYVYGFSGVTGTWAGRDLGKEAVEPEGKLERYNEFPQTYSSKMGFVRARRFICGFSVPKGTWDVLDIGEDTVPVSTPRGVAKNSRFLVQNDRLYVSKDDHLYTFNPETARFEDVETSFDPAPIAK